MLNRDDIGHLAPGMAADLAIFNLNSVAFAGARHDPAAALVFCSPVPAAYTVVNGRVVVRQGQLETLDLGRLVERHNQLAAELLAN